jgi:hypothetical protein
MIRMPRASPRELLECYFNDCVPQATKSRTFTALTQERINALADLWRYRDYHHNKKCSTYTINLNPYNPSLRDSTSFLRATDMFREVGRKFGVSGPRLETVARTLGVTYLAERRLGVTGKYFGIFLYTRYRPRKRETTNDVFTLRIYTPAPIGFSCDNSIAAANVPQSYLKALLRALLSSIKAITFQEGFFRPLDSSPECPNMNKIMWIGVWNWREEIPGLELAAAYDNIYQAMDTGGTVPEYAPDYHEYDKQLLKDVIWNTTTKQAMEDLVEAFTEELPTAEIKVGCVENPPELYSYLQYPGGLNETVNGRPASSFIERGGLSGSCYDVSRDLNDVYCKALDPHFPVDTGTPINMKFGSGFKWAREALGSEVINVPVWLWANGFLKVPLVTPALAMVERMHFSDSTLISDVELNWARAQAEPRQYAKELVRSFIDPYEPEIERAIIERPFNYGLIQTGAIPLTFYDLLGYIWVRA